MADDYPPETAGATNAPSRQQMLGESGVPTSSEAASDQDVQQAVAEGKGVITGHEEGQLWGNKDYDGGHHAILATGVKYGPDGNVQAVRVNDTGQGLCGALYSPERYFGSRNKWTNITKDPIVKT